MTSLVRHMFRSPLKTGSFVPSSRHLALAMARAAGSVEHIIELGAGTGPVTQALLESLPDATLVAVEIQVDLAARLRTKFPHLDVRQTSAAALLDAPGPSRASVTVVSSLPFRSLPAQVCQETIASLCRFLQRHPGSHLVQFTYQPRAPFPAPSGFAWRCLGIVWRNAPPAGVWVLRQVG